jgi:hypothetical protein
MTLPITFDPAATVDVIDAVHWYERQRAGLGAQFYAEISRLAALAAKYPARYPYILQDIRRLSSRRFHILSIFVRRRRVLSC